MVIDGIEEMFSLAKGFWWSVFGGASVVGHYIEDYGVVFVVGCTSYFVECLLQFVCGMFLYVVLFCRFVLFFVYDVECVLNVVFSKEFVVGV